MNEQEIKTFHDWLADEKFSCHPLMMDPEKMLKSPDSLTRQQRQWLGTFLSQIAARIISESDGA